MISSAGSLNCANRLVRESRFHEAIRIYHELLREELPTSLAASIRFSIEFSERRMKGEAIPFVGKQRVADVQEALEDTVQCNSSTKLRPGITALIRAKNAERFIRGSIVTIADLVDEIVAVDNNSSDGTLAILKDLEREYPHLKVYSYAIDLPQVGADHAREIEQGGENTLGTFYNWCLAKVTRFNVLKWDADFIGVRQNLKRLIDQYHLRTTSNNVAIWCTGVTAYYGKILNLASFYDEYRIFSKHHEARWENWQGCETLTPSINRTPVLHVFPSDVNVKRADKATLRVLKARSAPIFYEIKDFQNLKSDDMVIDARDRNDNRYIRAYKDTPPDYQAPDNINSYRVLIVLPNLKLGGGNYWAVYLYDALRHLGVEVQVGAQTLNMSSKQRPQAGRLGHIDATDLVEMPAQACHEVLNRYTHVILTAPLEFDQASVSASVYGFSHSEISYFNRYVLERRLNALTLNRSALSKFEQAGVRCKLLRNFLPLAMRTNQRESSEATRLLYCNRISDDKNALMLLSAFKALIDDETGPSANLTILAGGAEDLPLEYLCIQGAVRALGLEHRVTVLPSQQDVERFYLDHDLVVLPSISEGCSLGLLEAINHEVPIVSTDIRANTEVTSCLLPHFTLTGLQGAIDEIFSVDSKSMYLPLLEKVGYVAMDSVYQCSQDGAANYALLRGYADRLGLPFDQYRNKMKLFCPTLLPEISAHAGYAGSSLERYLSTQRALFERNVQELVQSLQSALHDIPKLRTQVRDLKKAIAPEYFSKSVHAAQLSNVLFGESLSFFAEFEPASKHASG